MRGLDARVTLAHARVMAVWNASGAERLMATAEHQALRQGLDDAGNGVHTMPVMFDDELSLAERWCAGQRRFEQGLDEAAWRARCEKMASDASNGCGLSHDYYVTRLSASVDWAMRDLADHEREAALQIAREFDYATVEEREQTAIDNANDGYCTHGIEMGCCPAGCDYPEDDHYEFEYYDPDEEEHLREKDIHN